MKKLSKLLALLVALCMVLTIGAFASGEPSGDPSGAPSGEAPAAGQSVEEAYVDYIHEFLLNELTVNTGGMTIEIIENEFMPAVEAGKYDEFPADMLYNGMLDSGVAMTFEEFAAQYVPAEAPASGEAQSVEDAFIEYIHEWLLDELEINSNMTIEQVEDEFMPLVREMNFVDFPAEMLYSGMLEQGCPMTFEEFAAQYQPAAAAPASGEAGSVEDAYIEYIHDFLLNELTVNTGGMTIEIIENEFMPAVEAGKYDEFPADMLYNGMLDSGVAMTFEEFAAQYNG